MLRKALKGDDRIDDSGEMLSYRAAVLTWLAGVAVMTIWLWQSGLPVWASFVTLMLAFLIFVGLTRVVVEGASAAAGRADDFFVGLGLDRRLFGDRTGGHGGPRVHLCCGRRISAHLSWLPARTASNWARNWGRGYARFFGTCCWRLFVSIVGSVAAILYLAYDTRHQPQPGGFLVVELAPLVDYITTTVKRAPAQPNIDGWIHTFVGGGIMALLMWARLRLLWWPLHPIGYPIGPYG